ncbi:chemotaxis protein CheB [Deinococcus hopiensis]|uniref:protein-glutamate methylesterase n=1 Tax=Deinococcus hopiensis KR-140 TaxID=695939 RepID=A0A1W1UZ71_9DEIO|nr:chemotaxis protein CheB [Deinococcus hopiensis]SMB86014.1 two-component system, chemotaxis family, response regulator CheB [Deinococcus hopiensis KR-140]
MPPTPVVVIGGSAGALNPLREIASGLPHDFPAAVLVVIHIPPDYPSQLPDILSRSGPLPAQHAQHGEPLLPGHIYVAPPDHHLLVGLDHLRLSRGPKENRSRPSIDVLFRSAAYAHRATVIGVLLSGMLDDGTSGLWTIKQLGGRAIVQHPEDAEFDSMPLNALRTVRVDFMVHPSSIAPTLQRLLKEPVPPQEEPSMNAEERQRLEMEIGIAGEDNAFEAGLLTHASPSTFTCPECHGVLMRLKEGNLVRFRCHTGHAYTAITLLGELRASVEASLWNAARTLDEDVMLLEHLAQHHEEAGQAEQAHAYREEAREARARGSRVRQDALRTGQLGQARLSKLTHGRDPGRQGT